MPRKVLIQIRRGLEKDIGTLAVGELGYCTDTQKLYVGTASGNVLLVAAQTVGDMLKSIYDTNNDGIVDRASQADAVAWSNVSGKPSSFTPSSHTHTKVQITDFPTSLPANGGNADTVDGKHANEFLQKGTATTWNDLKGV
ncbi:hyaluronate lyase N-terminal domain-containing protein [Schinkia azotoformans]|uniref:hyaluronate lyase N-terminal domain-containing protein n=1 Tax=Schinkia azotoformans TaxID=1454 RepID=UPI002DBA8492|nr:phage tail protein [Schinkia azotoformans]MEC1716593.1 phage tail protein [Schinkia azotoformans]MEC1739431.1 phage tail protein [Schinkia azotoformans]MEC1745499.1 phage tail protein [Schinkia azotoformans]MEC1756562.1 phage tail protein [Schinkia azotoformans]MEC1765829.1 phage tail protein [Schinkia azotoformans]